MPNKGAISRLIQRLFGPNPAPIDPLCPPCRLYKGQWQSTDTRHRILDDVIMRLGDLEDALETGIMDSASIWSTMATQRMHHSIDETILQLT